MIIGYPFCMLGTDKRDHQEAGLDRGVHKLGFHCVWQKLCVMC
jgi:hypothetical protein